MCSCREPISCQAQSRYDDNECKNAMYALVGASIHGNVHRDAAHGIEILLKRRRIQIWRRVHYYWHASLCCNIKERRNKGHHAGSPCYSRLLHTVRAYICRAAHKPISSLKAHMHQPINTADL
ncbi:hypothetical protein TNCV_883121 [Trichonephila clavipes]|nr:hypothetical protein TNCV_883121 [Trichonephila clavipes]